MPTVPTKVVFQFDQASWIEVRDVKGKRLLYRSFQAGRRIEVDGQPPFHVFLGNARGVKVEYLGQVSTRDAASGRLYTRFVLGASSG
jgi:cytoskeleton protein RodZ